LRGWRSHDYVHTIDCWEDEETMAMFFISYIILYELLFRRSFLESSHFTSPI
jgi:hypothetical protein